MGNNNALDVFFDVLGAVLAPDPLETAQRRAAAAEWRAEAAERAERRARTSSTAAIAYRSWSVAARPPGVLSLREVRELLKTEGRYERGALLRSLVKNDLTTKTTALNATDQLHSWERNAVRLWIARQ